MVPISSARLSGYAFAVASTAALAVTFIASKYVLRVMNRATFAPLWFAVAFFLSLVYLAGSRRWDALRTLRWAWRPVLGVGVLNTVSVVAFFWEIQRIDPTLVSFFGRLGTLYTVLFGVVLLRERLSREEMAGMVITLVGAALLTYRAAPIVWAAFLVALFGDALFASLSTLAGKVAVQQGADAVALAGARAGVTSFLTLVYALISGQFYIPSLPDSVLAAIPLGAFCGPFLSYVLLYQALARLEVSKVSIVRNLQPFFVAVYSFVLFHTLPGLKEMLGGVIVTAGVGLLIHSRTRSPLKCET